VILKLRLNSLVARAGVILGTLTLSAFLVFTILSHFVIGVIADPRVALPRDFLAAAADYFPNSSSIHIRLAEAELAETVDLERALARAEWAAARSASLSPWHYKTRLLLAEARESKGDRERAEQALREAVRLAPNYTDVHWRLANLRIRLGKLDQAVAEFRLAIANDASLLPGTLDLVWNISRGKFEAVNALTGERPQARLELAKFLLNRARADEAAAVFRGIDRPARLASSDAYAFLDTLLGAGRLELARSLWVELVSAAGNSPESIVWNGGFEANILKNFDQFDWMIGRSEYARIGVVSGVARSGARSLKIEFAGRDTTRLEREIRQMFLVRPGAHYRLECFVKTDGLVTPEGPRVVVSAAPSTLIAVSEPVSAGSRDWQPLVVDFVAPDGASALVVSIQRTPKLSYDDPTRGAIWFDDFAIKEQ
jgi:tetratricopeptide (TPR) repeat protein